MTTHQNELSQDSNRIILCHRFDYTHLIELAWFIEQIYHDVSYHS